MTDPPAAEMPRRALRTWGVAAVLYAVMVAWGGWPWLSDPTGHVLGFIHSADLVGTVWNWWWTAEALSSGVSPASCDVTFYPHGLWPFAQFNLVDAVFASPFVLALGPTAGYSAATLVMLWTNGLAVRWLARTADASEGAATAVGAIALLHPFISWELAGGRPTQAWIALPALALGAWALVAAGRGGWRVAVGAGVVSALTFLEYWYGGLFVGLGAIVLALPRLPLLREAEGRRRAAKAAVACAVMLVGILPFIWMLLDAQATLPGVGAESAEVDLEIGSRGEVGLHWAIMASRWPAWPLYGDVSRLPGPREPWALLAVALLPLVAYRKGRLAWAGVALLGYVLALGPYLQNGDGDVISMVPLPYLWLYDTLPLFSRFWWPYRLGMLMMLGLLVLAARNMDDLRAELGRLGWLVAPAVVLAVGIQVAGTEPFMPLGADTVPQPGPAYDLVKGPFINVPLFGLDDRSRLHLLFQPAHGQPMSYGLGAHIDGHRPEAQETLVAGNGFLSSLRSFDREGGTSVPTTEADIVALQALGFEQVVLERAAYAEDWKPLVESTFAPYIEGVLGPPELDDGRTIVWTLQWAGQQP
jgi:hypothetical protein